MVLYGQYSGLVWLCLFPLSLAFKYNGMFVPMRLTESNRLWDNLQQRVKRPFYLFASDMPPLRHLTC